MLLALLDLLVKMVLREFVETQAPQEDREMLGCVALLVPQERREMLERMDPL